MIDVKFKLSEKAVMPFYAHEDDAGMDLTAVSVEKIDNEHVKYGFGLVMEIPKGYVGLIFPRSSCYKQRQILSNCVGVIDSNCREEISVIMIGNPLSMYKVGERIAQLIILPYPKINPIKATELSETDRGKGVFGSTGK